MSSSSSDSEAQNSDSSHDSWRKKRRRKPQKAKATADSANDEEISCKGCGKKFRSQGSRYVHVRKCKAYQMKQVDLTCKWCDQVFSTDSALSDHTSKLHADCKPSLKDIQLKPKIFPCRSCDKTFKSKTSLKYHIRGVHFNLIGKAPYAEEKKVNQVWFEKVMNSNTIIEIKKIRHNMLVMKKMNENTAIKVNNDNERVIDVSHLYPTGTLKLRAKCKICNKVLLRHRIRNHIDEVHNNIRRYHCNKCKKSYKRQYSMQHHTCLAENVKVKSDSNVDSTSIKEPSKSLDS